MITSKWQDSYIDKEEQWAIIYFENTLFTPEGYDVISKQKQLISELEKQVDAKLKELNITEQLETIEQEYEIKSLSLLLNNLLHFIDY